MGSSYQSRRSYDVAPEAAFSAVRDLVRRRNYRVQIEDPESCALEVTTALSLRSWGERLYITATPGGNGSVVEVDSRSRMALVDWGKNRDNVEGLLDELGRVVS